MRGVAVAKVGLTLPLVATSYLLHPFGIATQLARSTIVFSNFFVALAIASALAGACLPESVRLGD